MLTITALAERSMAALAADRGWNIDYAEAPTLRAGRRPKMGLRFTEKMTGFIGPGEDFEQAANAGKAAGTPLEFTLTIETDDLETMLSDSGHEAGLGGTVIAPSLSAEPLSATTALNSCPRICGLVAPV